MTVQGGSDGRSQLVDANTSVTDSFHMEVELFHRSAVVVIHYDNANRHNAKLLEPFVERRAVASRRLAAHPAVVEVVA